MYKYTIVYLYIRTFENLENVGSSRHKLPRHLQFCVGDMDPSGQNWSDTDVSCRHVTTCRRHFQLSSHLHHIFELKKPPPEVERWTAEDEERLQNLRGKEISMEDTAVGRKKIGLEQQLSAVTLSMSSTKWNQLVQLRKHKYGEEEVTAAAEEVVQVDEKSLGTLRASRVNNLNLTHFRTVQLLIQWLYI
jgi:hypothetical protein